MIFGNNQSISFDKISFRRKNIVLSISFLKSQVIDDKSFDLCLKLDCIFTFK